MQSSVYSEDVVGEVTLRCIAAGLLRAGEQLDCRAHGAERHQNVEDEIYNVEYDDCHDYGWEPKESIQKIKEEVRSAVAPFQCCGFGDRMGLHDVQASLERPAKVFAMTTKFTSLTPFDETWHTSIKFQCVACRDAMEAPAKEATKRRKAKEKMEQDPPQAYHRVWRPRDGWFQFEVGRFEPTAAEGPVRGE